MCVAFCLVGEVRLSGASRFPSEKSQGVSLAGVPGAGGLGSQAISQKRKLFIWIRRDTIVSGSEQVGERVVLFRNCYLERCRHIILSIVTQICFQISTDVACAADVAQAIKMCKRGAIDMPVRCPVGQVNVAMQH